MKKHEVVNTLHSSDIWPTSLFDKQMKNLHISCTHSERVSHTFWGVRASHFKTHCFTDWSASYDAPRQVPEVLRADVPADEKIASIRHEQTQHAYMITHIFKDNWAYDLSGVVVYWSIRCLAIWML